MTRGVDVKEGPYVNNSVQYPLATELQTNYSDNFRHVIRASWVQDYILTAGDKKLSGKGQFMDEDAPEMLTLKMQKGNWVVCMILILSCFQHPLPKHFLEMPIQ